jgi:protein TonB
MPAARRRFLVILWLSLALHALVIGLTQLPPQVRVPLPPDLRVEISRSAPAAQTVQPMPPSDPASRRPAAKPLEALPPLRQESARPQAPPPAAAPVQQAQPAAASPVVPGRESQGPVLNVPLLADVRYYTARELDVQPFALRRPQPAYPARAEEQEVAGRVLVRLHLEADGSVSKTEVVSVTPGGVYGEMFRKATLESLKDARFKPAQRDGQPVRAVVEIPVVFEPDV